MKLFIDDFRSAPEGWHLAKTITEAIRILSGPIQVDVVSLDHDIIFETTNRKVGFSQETFATVARYIAAMPKELLPRIVYIHTANPNGAKDMAEILKGIVTTHNIENDTHFNTHGDYEGDINYKDILLKLEQEREERIQEHRFEGEF